MNNFLKGKKTKIIIIATIIYAIAGLIIGEVDANIAYGMIAGALATFGIYDKMNRNLER